jgi:hypothetical protein
MLEFSVKESHAKLIRIPGHLFEIEIGSFLKHNSDWFLA